MAATSQFLLSQTNRASGKLCAMKAFGCTQLRRWKSIDQRGRSQFTKGRELASRCQFATVEGSFPRSLCTSAASVQFLTNPSAKETQRRNMSTNPKPSISIDTINPNVKLMEYAVRGPLVIRAAEIERELKRGEKKPFTEVIRANIGDCHAMGQKPITFIRQVLALAVNPSLMDKVDYPEDVKDRAKQILCGCHGVSLGSYTDSTGIEVIRRQVAAYIEERDGGIPADFNDIVLTAGASPGIKSLLAMFNCVTDGKHSGIMVPIPQYPLYSATIVEQGMEQIGYYLDEDASWGLDINELERAINEGRKKSAPRVIVVINPGNPTGQVLTRKNIEEIIKFAHRHNLFIFADEVYQHNVYDKDSKFHSFKKVLTEMGEPYSKMQLASFMSCSKGYMGECGIRGGYAEIVNMPADVKAMFFKSLSAQLCSTTIGQAATFCIVNPPRPGEPSYELYAKERSDVLNSLKERAALVHKMFNSFEGFKCNTVQGAMYAFPQLTLPPKAIEQAKKANKAPDVFYAFELLENTGVCIVPGSGFGQKPGTYHFRTTILPQTEKLKEMLQKFQKFHVQFMEKYK